MKISEERALGGTLIVSSIGPEGFTIAGRVYPGPLLVWTGGVAPIVIASESDMTAEKLAALIDLDPKPEVAVIGCGPKAWLPRPSLKGPLRDAGIPSEFMDTRAAARTYNLMVMDGRTVAAILLPF